MVVVPVQAAGYVEDQRWTLARVFALIATHRRDRVPPVGASKDGGKVCHEHADPLTGS